MNYQTKHPLADTTIKSNLFHNEFGVLSTPRSAKVLLNLETDEAFNVLGRFVNGLILNEKVTIPIKGPALEIVSLIRLLGECRLSALIDAAAIEFCFCPGTLAYVSERNIREGGFKLNPGIHLAYGTDGSWKNIADSVVLALTEQLGFSQEKARLLADKINMTTKTLSPIDIYKKIEQSSYTFAANSIDAINNIEELKKLDHKIDNDNIKKLLDIASIGFDLTCSYELGCSEITGNDLTWEIVKKSFNIKTGTKLSTEAKLNSLLELEGIPDMTELVKRGKILDKIIDIRKDNNITEFREWLNKYPDQTDKEMVKMYYRAISEKISDKPIVKLLRIGFPISLGFMGKEGIAAGIICTLVDAFWAEKIINGWNPKIFIDKHFIYPDNADSQRNNMRSDRGKGLLEFHE